MIMEYTATFALITLLFMQFTACSAKGRPAAEPEILPRLSPETVVEPLPRPDPLPNRCHPLPASQLGKIAPNTATVDVCVPAINLEVRLDVDPSKAPYSLDGVDAADFVLDNGSLTIYWKNPEEVRDSRLYAVNVKDKDNNLQMTLRMNASLPTAIQIILGSMRNIDNAPIQSKGKRS